MRRFDRQKLANHMSQENETTTTLAAALVLLAARQGEEIALSKGSIQNWLDGKHDPNALHLGLLATHYGGTEGDFFSWKGRQGHGPDDVGKRVT